jgi:hypothetical protein
MQARFDKHGAKDTRLLLSSRVSGTSSMRLRKRNFSSKILIGGGSCLWTLVVDRVGSVWLRASLRTDHCIETPQHQR